ncbi:MAG: hypothetical protein ACI8TQ_002050 [Planctomycetota bacterium]|jgi:hypothetical protein
MSNPENEQSEGPAVATPNQEKIRKVRLMDWIRPGLAALLLPLGWLAQLFAGRNSVWIEEHYSQDFFPRAASALASLSEKFPISLAEIFVGLLVLRLLFGLVRTLWRLFGPTGERVGQRLESLGLGALRLTGAAGILYGLYLASWGFNHQRQPFAEVAGFDASAPKVVELTELAAALADELIELRHSLEEDGDGHSRQTNTRAELQKLASDAFAKCSDIHPSLHSVPGVSRRPASSFLMSASGISGIYFPLTAEAHVNGEIPDSQLGFVTCHELAHSLGFAREDEANFLAYLASTQSQDASMRYSGRLAAFRYVLTALRGKERRNISSLIERVGEPVRRDLQEIDDFWARERTEFTAVARRVNHGYLKSQGQSEGVASYGSMVDLLVANLRRTRPNFKAEPLASALVKVRQRSVRIAFVGGCFTSGGELEERFSFPDRVGEMLVNEKVATEIINLGVCHQNSQQAALALEQAIAANADIVVFERGSRNLEAKGPLEQVQQSFEIIILSARRAGLRVFVLANLEPTIEREEESVAMLSEQIKKYAVAHAAEFGVGVRANREMLRSDLEHPNGAGIWKLAEQTVPALWESIGLVRRGWALELVEQQSEQQSEQRIEGMK